MSDESRAVEQLQRHRSLSDETRSPRSLHRNRSQDSAGSDLVPDPLARSPADFAGDLAGAEYSQETAAATVAYWNRRALKEAGDDEKEPFSRKLI